MWPALAAIASFLFPGAGQALAGHPRYAIGWAVAGLVPLVLCLWLPAAFLVWVLIRIPAAIDAARVVRNAQRTRTLTVQLGVIVAVSQLAAFFLIRLVVLETFVNQTTSMVPAIGIGDRVLVDKLTPRFGGYHRAEVVVFRHPLLGVAYIKRIVAVGGDDVAVRDGVLLVNGQAAAQTRIGDASYWDRVDDRGEWSERKAIAYREDLEGAAHTIYRAPHLASEAVYEHDYPRPGDPHPCAVSGVVLPQLEGRAPAADVPPMTLSRDGTACVVPRGAYFLLGDSRDNSVDSRSWGAVPAELMIGRAVGILDTTDNPHVGPFGRLGRIH